MGLNTEGTGDGLDGAEVAAFLAELATATVLLIAYIWHPGNLRSVVHVEETNPPDPKLIGGVGEVYNTRGDFSRLEDRAFREAPEQF
jgi:hypothetical protein